MSSALLYKWRAYPAPEGTAFYPPEGGLVAGIYVRERLRPLEPVRYVLGAVKRKLAGAVNIEATTAIEPITTVEGEYGAIVGMTGVGKEDGGKRMHYTVGLVFGDDFYDRIDAFYVADSAKLEEYRELVRQFIHNYPLNLGDQRARRFYYKPPPGWLGRSRNLLAQWFPHDFPKHLSNIIVPASFPSSRQEGSVMARTLLQRRQAGFKVDVSNLEPVKHPLDLQMHLHHMHGRFTREESPVTELLTAVLTDHQHIYVARLETTAEWLATEREILLDLARSIRPFLPVTRQTKDAMADLMHWVAD